METCLIQRKDCSNGSLNDRERPPRRQVPEGASKATAAVATRRLPGTERQRLPRLPSCRRAPGFAVPPPPRIPAHLGHIVLHLVQVSVLQGPHELLVAHHCSGLGRQAGHKWRVRPTRGHEETTRLGPPRGRGCGLRRPLGREKVLLQPLGPAEQVPPGWGRSRTFALPVHAPLGPASNFLFLFLSTERPAPDPAPAAYLRGPLVRRLGVRACQRGEEEGRGPVGGAERLSDRSWRFRMSGTEPGTVTKFGVRLGHSQSTYKRENVSFRGLTF